MTEPNPVISAPDAEAGAGDLVLFWWGEHTLTARLVTHPFPDRAYLSVRTRKNDFRVPRGHVWPLESLIAPPWDPDYEYPY